MNICDVLMHPLTLFTQSTTPLENLRSNFQNEFCPLVFAKFQEQIDEHFSTSQPLPFLVAITECESNGHVSLQCYNGFALQKHFHSKYALIMPYNTPCNRVHYFVMHERNQPLELLTTCTSYEELPNTYCNACINKNTPAARSALIDQLIRYEQYKEATAWIGYFVRDFYYDPLAKKFTLFFRDGIPNEELIRENGRFILQQHRCESYLQRATKIALLSLCTFTTLTMLPHASPELHLVINLGVGFFTPEIQQKIQNIIFNN